MWLVGDFVQGLSQNSGLNIQDYSALRTDTHTTTSTSELHFPSHILNVATVNAVCHDAVGLQQALLHKERYPVLFDRALRACQALTVDT